MVDWTRYPHFSKSEFQCSYTGKCEMRPEFLELLQKARIMYAAPIYINSGYRDVTHPKEAKKDEPGEHTLGLAADINVQGVDAMDLFTIFYALGVRRIGLDQKGKHRFMHVGIGDKYGFPKALWTY